jgi:transcriptional regulator with XRE-family HTH domain
MMTSPTGFRGYSLRLCAHNTAADPASLGVQLGHLCIAQDVPVTDVARQLGVSRQTLYNWFCGVNTPQRRFLPAIEAYIASLT